MQKLMLMLLVGIVALAPAIAAAQLSSGAPGSTRPNSPLQGSGGPGTRPDYSGSETSPPGASGGPNGATSAPGDPSSSPSASPSQTSDDFAKYTTPADCEKASGVWLRATNKCVRK
jgi:hypothetical protein